MDASATVTPAGTSYSSGQLVGSYIEALILVNATALTAGTTLDITIETSSDDTTYYPALSTLTQMTTATTQIKAITNFGKYIRTKKVVAGTGTPSVTFSITGVFKT